MDLVLNVFLGDVDLTYSMSWFSLHLFMSFRRSLFRRFSASLRFFLNSLFEHLWPLLPVNNKSCLFLCPLFILFKWGLFIEQVFLLLLQASHQGVHPSHWPYLSGPYLSVPHNQNWQTQNMIPTPDTVKLSGRRMHLVLCLTSGLSASCANILMLTNLSRAVAWTQALFCDCSWCLICWHTSWHFLVTLASIHPN